MASNVNNSQSPVFNLNLPLNLPKGVRDQILSYLDDPKDLVSLAKTGNQTHQILTYTDHTNEVPSEMEKQLYRIFSGLGLYCPLPDCNKSVQNFLKNHKTLINKLQRNDITDSPEDILQLARASIPQNELIRIVFENSLSKKTSQWEKGYATFSNLINDFTIPMNVRDEIHYGVTSSKLCNPQSLAIKSTMSIATRSLDRAAENCDITYIEARLADFTSDQLGKAFVNAVRNYCYNKADKYLKFWQLLLSQNLPEGSKINALKTTAKYGDIDSFGTIFKTLSSKPTNDSLEEIIFISAIHEQSRFLKVIIESPIFANNIHQLLELRWVLAAIGLPGISDEMVEAWIKVGICNAKTVPSPDTYSQYIPLDWMKADSLWWKLCSALNEPDASLPHLLIKHKRFSALEKFANLGKLKSDRYPNQKISFPLQFPSVFTPQFSYNMLPAYKIEEPQKEVLSESTPQIKEVFSKNDTEIGIKLAFLSANGYAEAVGILLGLDKATPNEIGEALVQAVTFRCSIVVNLILSSKPLDILKEPIDSLQDLIPLGYYKKCLRIAAMSGFTEIFESLLSKLSGELDILEEPLLDALIFGNEKIASIILEKHPNISVKILENCLAAIHRLKSLTLNHYNILIRMFERVQPKQISQCNPSLLTKTLEKLITLGQEQTFNKLLVCIPPIYLKNVLPLLINTAIEFKKEGIIEQLFNLKRVLRNESETVAKVL